MTRELNEAVRKAYNDLLDCLPLNDMTKCYNIRSKDIIKELEFDNIYCNKDNKRIIKKAMRSKKDIDKACKIYADKHVKEVLEHRKGVSNHGNNKCK